MNGYTLILLLTVFFVGTFLLLISYFEYYKIVHCRKPTKPTSEFEYIPILQRETHLDDQFDVRPYELYRDYFDQNSPWIGTIWIENKGSHEAEVFD